MCIGLPGKIIAINSKMAVADIGGVQVEVALDLVPTAKLGDSILIHTGYAVQIIDEEAAMVTWQLIKELTKSE